MISDSSLTNAAPKWSSFLVSFHFEKICPFWHPYIYLLAEKELMKIEKIYLENYFDILHLLFLKMRPIKRKISEINHLKTYVEKRRL